MFVSPNSRPQAFLTNVLIGETYKLHVDQMVQGGKFNRNVSVPTNQVRHPWELLRVGATEGDSPAIVQQGDGSLADFMYRIKNDIPPSELSMNALMAGIRLLGPNAVGSIMVPEIAYIVWFTFFTSSSSAVSQPGA